MFATYLVMFCRITIAFLFIFSFASKILSLRNFAVTIGDFKVFPRRWSKGAALLFLGGDITTAVLLTVGGDLLLIGFLLAMVLLTIFSVALVIGLWRKIDVNCNCFGRNEQRISRYDVARNVFLILCSLIGLWMLKYDQRSMFSGEIIMLALISLVVLTFAINLDDVVETLRRPFVVSEERR